MGRGTPFYRKTLVLFLVLALLCEPLVICKRSGHYGGSRGGSPSRSGSLRSRISSAFGRKSSPSSYGRPSGSGGGGLTGRLFGNRQHRPNYGGTSHRGTGRGLLGGGLLGGRHRSGGGGGRGLFGSRNRGMGGGFKTSMFRNSGIGSRSRSSTFKNMIVGAAAGFLAYKAGKAIIRNVAAPMMWNNRRYYWGQQYYPSHAQYGPGGQSRTMCRMPIDPSDPQLGQVYMSDHSRPKEIVWSCEYHEECCGYECCPRGMAVGGGARYSSSSGSYEGGGAY